MSTYADNRRRQRALRGTNQKSPVQDRIAPFLRSVLTLNPITAPVAIPTLYGQGMLEAALDAQKRGSKIPFLPEFGLSEGFQSYADQAGRDLQAAFNPAVQTPEPDPVVPETPETPVISEQMSPESQARFDETLRMMDVIGNVPLKKEPELSAEDKARKAFESKTNNPARDAGLDPNFLFARHKANLASQLAKQGVTVEEAKANPEQAFLADQLGKYLGSKREFNSGRDRGF